MVKLIRPLIIATSLTSTLPFRTLASQHPLFDHHRKAMSSDGQAIKLEGKRLQVLQDTLSLFQSKPSLEILSRSWSPDGVFEDPIALCHGFKQYAPQWFGMPKAFPKSETLDYKVTKNEGDTLEYEQTQKYTIRGIGTTKVIKSLVSIRLDSDDKIVHFQDRWGGKPLPTNAVALFLRRLNARTLPWLISVPKDDK